MFQQIKIYKIVVTGFIAGTKYILKGKIRTEKSYVCFHVYQKVAFFLSHLRQRSEFEIKMSFP